MLRPAGAGLAGAIALAAITGGAARADRVIAVAPLATLGTEDTSAAVRKLTAQLEAAIGALPDTRVVTAAQVAESVRRAKRPQLRSCEGEAACLAELGKLVGAALVVAGEVGGLGEAKVVYLGATDVATGAELRSTTLGLGGAADADGARGAAVRLLDPDRYRGTLRLAIDVPGATVYVNGARSAAGRGELELPVGTHAVRVTHPAYHDFVRFIEVRFGEVTPVGIQLQQYPIVQRDVAGRAGPSARAAAADVPRWRRWYVVIPAAVGVALVAGVAAAALARDAALDAPCSRPGGDPC